MEIVTKKHMMLFSGTAHPELSEEIASHLDVPLSKIEIRRFDRAMRASDPLGAPDRRDRRVLRRLKGRSD